MENETKNGTPVVLGLAVALLAIVLYLMDRISLPYAVAGFLLASAAPVAGMARHGRLAFAVTLALAAVAVAVGVVTH